MEITAICHATLLYRENASTLLVDPWLSGKVFLSGWALAPEPLPEVIAALPTIDYIYLTHEHPDHTHIPTLKTLFDGAARNAVLLIPAFMTDRFVKRLEATFPGRPIRELRHGKPYRFGPWRLWSYQYRNDDSTLVVTGTSGYTAVNSNDTFIKGLPLDEIATRHPAPDVVFSQYSTSNAYPYAYSDYEQAPESFPWQKSDLNEYCVRLLRTLKPRCWVPYHSFVSFCQPENAYLEAYKTTLQEIVDFVSGRLPEVRVLKLFPGDTLTETECRRHPDGESRFVGWKTVMAEPRTASNEELLKAVATFEASFRETVAYPFRRKLRSCGFQIDGEETCLRFDPVQSRFQIGIGLRLEHPELAWHTTSRSALTGALKMPWGMADLLISGRMRTEVPAQHRAVDFLFWAVALIRHTGYFNLKVGWFLRPRALDGLFRRRREVFEILLNSVRGAGFLKGNILPRKASEKVGEHG